jgi:hypothetical protein
MKNIILISILVIGTISVCNSQSIFYDADIVEYPYYKWKVDDIEACNTAKHANYLTEEEKNAIWLINLARLDGALFAETFLSEYIEQNELDHTYYVRSLLMELKRIHFLELLEPKKKITKIAEGHALWSGKNNSTGHQNFDERAKKVKRPNFSECCDYGYNKGLDIVMDLLIDEGVASLGHRKNLLDKNIKYIGISIQPHPEYGYNCVIDCSD